MRVSVNNFVVCKPFKEVKTTTKGSLALVSKKSELIPLYPIYPTEFVGSSVQPITDMDTIYVRSECMNKPWAKEVFTYAGVGNSDTFILVPASEIVMIDRLSTKEVN